MKPVWIDVAGKYLGQRETFGPNDSPWIRRMLAALNISWLIGQPWCGIFLARVMKESGIEYPKAYYRASAWRSWGVGLAKPCVGCVVVMERRGGGHVGIVIGKNLQGNLVVRGGNQGDSVRDSVFLRERVGGYMYRYPNGQPLPEDFQLPVLAASTSISEA